MGRIIKYSSEAREKLIAGVNKVANAVKVTLGPEGRNVVISMMREHTHVTKDGVTVARSIELEDWEENVGATLMKEIASKTAKIAGDGTTTATVLAQYILNRGFNALAKDKTINPMELQKGMLNACERVCEELANLSIEVGSEQDLINVATVSANNDKAIGELIGQAFYKIGKHGKMDVKESQNGKTYMTTVSGFEFPKGYVHPAFVTNHEDMTAVYQDCYVIVTDKEIRHLAQFQNALGLTLGQSAKERKPLVVICKDIDGECLATLVLNKQRMGVPVVAIKAPFYGNQFNEVIGDIALLCGATLISDDYGTSLENMTEDMLGGCAKIIVGENTTSIVGGHNNPESVVDLLRALETRALNAEDEEVKEFLNERISRIKSSAAILWVAAKTETEMKEKKDRIDDAKKATQAALEEGIVPGGGHTLLCIGHRMKPKSLDAAYALGQEIVLDALSIPLKTILANSGDESASMKIFGKIVSEDILNINYGYDARKRQFGNLIELGVIDPTKVVRVALENATSIASLLLTTETLIVRTPEGGNNG